MAKDIKSKTSGYKAEKRAKKEAKKADKKADKLSKAKAGRVGKSSQSGKAQSRNVAKAVAAKVEKGKKSKKKEPTPVSESESESEASESEAESESGSSSSESEVEKKSTAKPTKTNGTAHPLKADESSDSDDSESDEDAADSRVNGVAAKDQPTKKAASESSDSSDSSDSDESEDEKKPFKPDSSASEEAAAADDSSSSDSSDDSSDESEKEEAPNPKKRKAEAEAVTETKKSKTENDAADNDSLPSKTLFIGHLSFNIDEEWLQREFAEHGEVTRTVVVTRPDGKSKGFGYVEFATSEAAQAAKEAMTGAELDGRAINIDFAAPKPPREEGASRAQRYGDQTNPPSKNLFIGNLSFDIENNDLSDYFSQFGTLTRVSIPTDRETGQVKGFGYVEFETIEEAKAAFEGSSGQELKGRRMRLDYSSSGPQNGGSGGRGGGGFRGGRGGGRGGGDFRGGHGGGGFRGGRGGGRGGGGFGGGRGGGGGYQGKKTTFD